MNTYDTVFKFKEAQAFLPSSGSGSTVLVDYLAGLQEEHNAKVQVVS